MSEPLHALAIKNDKIIIAVTNKGFTDTASFRIDAVSGTTGFMLTIVRVKPDDGKMMPHMSEVELLLPEDCKGQSFTVENHFSVGPKLQSAEAQRNPA